MPKHLRIPCPDCRRSLRISPQHVERQVQCKHCDHSFLIPKYLALKCPTCTKEGRVRTVNVGRRIRCKDCGAMLHALAEDHPSISSGEWRRKALGVSSAPGESLQPAVPSIFEMEVARLKTELEARGAERAAAIQQLAEAQRQAALLEEKIRTLQDQLTVAQTSPAGEIEARLRKELAQARDQIETLWVQVNLQEHEAERTALLREELQSLRKENAGFNDDLSRARAASTAELEASQARCRELECELLAVRTQYEAYTSDGEEIERLTEELHQAQVERESLANRIAELEQTVPAAATRPEPEPESEPAGSLAERDQTWQAKLDEAEERLRSEQARIVVERRAWSDEVEVLQRQFDEGCRALQTEIDRLGQQIESLLAERDEALEAARGAAGERDEISAERAAAEATHRLEVRRLQGELEALSRAVDQAREREVASLRRQEELSAELERMQSEREELGQHQHGQNANYERALIVLQQELKAAVTELDAERARLMGAAESTRSELEGQLSDSFRKYEQAQAMAARLEAELRAANQQIDGLCQDLGLVRDGGGVTLGAPISTGQTSDRRVEELARQLHEAQRENAQLRSMVDYLGVEDHARR